MAVARCAITSHCSRPAPASLAGRLNSNVGRRNGATVGFDISFEKPTSALGVPNAELLNSFLVAFPEYRAVPLDIDSLAIELAGVLELSVEDFIRLGIGLQVEPADPSASVHYIAFFQDVVVVTLTNFPDEGPAAALQGIRKARAFFAERGFHPPENDSPRGDEDEDTYLLRCYMQRQRLVVAAAAQLK